MFVLLLIWKIYVMNYNISFQEMAKLGMEIVSKQPPVSLVAAKKQVEKLKKLSTQKNKKQRSS